MKIQNIIIGIALLTISCTSNAAPTNKTIIADNANVNTSSTDQSNDNLNSDTQKIIDDYKDYAAKLPQKTREEIVAYRKEIAKINKKKRNLYSKLSQEAQGYLSEVAKIKKKLSINKQKQLVTDLEKAALNSENTGE